MTIEALYDTLNGVMPGKVAYNAWPESNAPELPFICYHVDNYEIMYADDKPFFTSGTATVELYTDDREPATEYKLEMALIDEGFAFDKQVDYIDSEKCYMVTYTMSL